MPKTTVELREERVKIVTEARTKWDEAKARESGPTAEDKADFEKRMDAAAELKADYERIERLEAEERELAEPEDRKSPNLEDRSKQRKGAARTAREYMASPEYREVYREWLTTGEKNLAAVPAEHRDSILLTDGKGGYLATPVQLQNDFIKQVDNLVYIRQLATKWTIEEGKAAGIPQLTTRMADANWTTEVAAVSEDTTMGLDRRDLIPKLLSKLSKVSIMAIAATKNIESVINTELSYASAITQEKGFLTADGSGKPLGMFTASASGVPTSRDVSTGNTTTAFTVANLFAVKYSLKAGYRQDPTCRWIFARPGVQMAMTLQDGENRYLWQPSLQADTPDRLLNIPVLESEYAPSTFTTGLYVGLLGALRYYHIADRDTISIQRLVERYADTNEIGFILRQFVDGAPVLGEAFSRVKLA